MGCCLWGLTRGGFAQSGAEKQSRGVCLRRREDAAGLSDAGEAGQSCLISSLTS